ncbi:MAG: purine-nucleoside phosphorylase [Ruminococcus sp.]|nr:purine-nucleoside phosphorylase [Ruminococcus sp.]
MSKYYEKIKLCLQQIKDRTDFAPDIALVLGSGLGDFAENIEVAAVIPYSEIEGFPVSTAPGHAGRFILGTISGKRVIAMQGRVHYYEGYEIQDVVMPIRLMRLMGASKLILTNAAGGISEESYPGSFMLINDHICLVPSPLIGENLSIIGTRFPSMDNIYDRDLRKIVLSSAESVGVKLFEGVYLQTSGPQYETPAEIRMFKNHGAGAVGMSTAVEAIAAVHAGFDVIGISCISNMACGLSDTPPSEAEVLEIASKAGADFSKLLKAIISNI